MLKATNPKPASRIYSLDTAYRMVAPVICGGAIGYFLDRWLHTGPWWMLGLMLFGLVTGCWSIYKLVYPADQENPK